MADHIDLSSIQNNGDSDEETTITPPNSPVNNVEEIKPVNSIDKRRTILVIQRYALEFEQYLGSLNKSASELELLNEDQLKSLLEEIKFTVSVRNSGKMSERAILMSISQLENFCCAYTPLNVKGLSNICKDEDFVMTVKEFCLENINLFYVPASYRLCYALLMSATNLHMYNTNLESKQQSTSIGDDKIDSIKDDKIKNISDKFDKLVV